MQVTRRKGRRLGDRAQTASTNPAETPGTRRAARNVVASYSARATTGVSVLVVTPVLYRAMGPAGFGTWSVILTIASSFTLFEMGFSQGIAKFVAEQNALSRFAAIRETIRAGTAIFTVVAVLGVCACVALAVFGAGLATFALRTQFQQGLLVLAAATAIRFPLVAYAGAIQGLQRYDLFYISDIVLATFFAAGACVVVAFGGSVLALSVVWSLGLVLSALIYPVAFGKLSPKPPHDPTAPDPIPKVHWRQLAGFSSAAVLSESTTFIAQRMDTVIIAAIRNAAAAGPYAAAVKLQSGVQALTLPFALLLLPMVSDLRARGRDDEVARRFALATRVSLQITLPVAAGLTLFAPDAVRLWLGHNVPVSTFGIVGVLMAVQTVTLTAFPAQAVLVGVGKLKWVAYLAVAEALSNVGASIALVSAFGAIGAALGSLITSAVLAPIKVPLACRAIGYRCSTFLRHVAPAVVGALPSLLVMGLAKLLLPVGPFRLMVGFFGAIVLALAVGTHQLGWERARVLVIGILPSRGHIKSSPS